MTSLSALIAALDDAALAALTSDGALRRAQTGLAKAGAVGLVRQTDTTADLAVDGQEVKLNSAGLAQARCTCPATGTCRHVLMAVLHLRETAPAIDPPALSARELIAALPITEIEAFAGSDWPEALRLAAATQAATVEEEGSSCSLVLAAAPGPVVFPAGGGLRQALFRGPERHRRTHVAAAALVLGGHALPTVADLRDRVDPALLDEAAAAVRSALWHGLRGDPVLAQDRLVDVGISARADAAPRLASLLRNAAHQAGLLATRDPDADPAAYLAQLAECDALLRALRKAPDDPVLCGVLRRSFQPGTARDVSVLGVGLWRTGTGARGVTIHAWDGARFLFSGPARGGGVDPGFSAQHAYRQPWWQGLSPAQLSGRKLHLPAPELSADGVLSGQCRATADPKTLGLADLPLLPGWSAVRVALATRRGLGLRQSTRPLPVLVRLVDCGAPRLDVIDQTDLLDLIDESGASEAVVLPDAKAARKAHELRSQITGALVEVSGVPERPRLVLVTLYLGDPVRFWNVTADPAPALAPSSVLQSLARQLRQSFRPAPSLPPANRLRDFADRVMLALCAQVSAPFASTQLSILAEDAEVLGLARVAKGLRGLTSPDAEACLSLAWQVSLLRRAAG